MDGAPAAVQTPAMVKTLATVTCPECGHQTRRQMPTSAIVRTYDCPACGVRTQIDDGECCIFCVLGDRRCPPRQLSWRADANKPG